MTITHVGVHSPDGDEMTTTVCAHQAVARNTARTMRSLYVSEPFTMETCKCDHPISKHLHVNLGGDGREYGRCTLCPCRLFRASAGGTGAA